jgi:hypothetical protein
MVYHDNNKLFQRTDGLAGGNESGRNDLSEYSKLSKGRDLWIDESNEMKEVLVLQGDNEFGRTGLSGNSTPNPFN